MWAQRRGTLGVTLGELLVWLVGWDLYLGKHESAQVFRRSEGWEMNKAAVVKEGFLEEVA